jgi:hypothetical protein
MLPEMPSWNAYLKRHTDESCFLASNVVVFGKTPQASLSGDSTVRDVQMWSSDMPTPIITAHKKYAALAPSESFESLAHMEVACWCGRVLVMYLCSVFVVCVLSPSSGRETRQDERKIF